MTKLPSQPNINEIANELEAKASVKQTAAEQENVSDTLNQALDDLKQGKSPVAFSADPEFQAALRLHVATSNSEIDDDYQEELEQIILKQCTSPQQEQTERVKKPKIAFWLVPSLSVAAVAAFVFIVTQSSLPGVLHGQQTQEASVTTTDITSTKNSEIKKTGKNTTGTASLATDSVAQTNPVITTFTTNASPTLATETTAGENDDSATQDTDKTMADLNTALESNSDNTDSKTIVQAQLSEVEALKAELETTISSLENLLDEVESLEASLDQPNTDMDAILTEISSI